MEFLTTTAMALEAVTLLLITICAYFYWKYKDFPPGPYGIPLLGYTPFLGALPHVTLRNLSKKYGPILSVNMGNGKQVVVVNDWPSIREMLVKQGDTFAMRPPVYIFQMLFPDRGDIGTTDGPVMKELKRVSTNILKELGMGRSSFETLVVTEVDKLATYLKTRDNELVDVDTVFFIPLLNVIWRLTSGDVFEANDSEMKSFADSFHELGTQTNVGILNVWPFLRFVIPELSGYRKFYLITTKIHGYIKKVVRRHWDAADNTGRQTDFIYRFIEEIKRRQKDNTDRPPYCNNNLVGVTLNLFVGGIETTDTTLHWSLVLMACHPEIQEKVQAELDKVIAKDEQLPYSSRTLIPYTMATLSEIQRYSSIFPLSIPHTSDVDVMLLGFKIPKGTSVIPNLWALHHEQEYWDNPDEFLPERFLNEDGTLSKRHERLLPFGAGPRSCMGEPLAKLELFLFFTCLMRRFSFRLDSSQKTASLLEPKFGFILRLPPVPLLVKCR